MRSPNPLGESAVQKQVSTGVTDAAPGYGARHDDMAISDTWHDRAAGSDAGDGMAYRRATRGVVGDRSPRRVAAPLLQPQHHQLRQSGNGCRHHYGGSAELRRGKPEGRVRGSTAEQVADNAVFSYAAEAYLNLRMPAG